MGGEGKRRTPALAARYAAEFNAPFVSIATAAVLYRRVAQACENVGRDPATLALSAGAIICCGTDAAEVQRRAAAVGIDAADPAPGVVCGTPDQVAEQVDAWSQAGAEHLYLEVDDLDDLEHVGLLGSVLVDAMLTKG